MIDQDQRGRQKPTWTTDVAGKVFGIDSQFIHVAGIKIPTAAPALLPISLPQGNYDEQRRARPAGGGRGGPMEGGRATQTPRGGQPNAGGPPGAKEHGRGGTR